MVLSKSSMYRFPWSSNDNPIGWLEVTDRCNIYCRGCYRMNGKAGHKSFAQIKEEIDILQRMRNCDNISIAGGEPLLHPDILDVVAYIKDRGMKPMVLTNGVLLVDNRPLIQELKQAGAIGFTFHVDSEQNRPHYKGKNETELCELRLQYANMVADVGGMTSVFGMTVYPTNVDQVPNVVRWANEHIDVVHGLVFITFRGAPMDGSYNYFVNGKPLDNTDLTYTTEDDSEIHITSELVYEKIKEVHPHYQPAAFLGGTQTHSRATWVSAVQVGSRKKMYGSLGKKLMELVQDGHHFLNGTYLIYQKSNKLPKVAFLGGLLDKGMREIHGKYWLHILRNPIMFFSNVYWQSIGIVQGPDLLADGRMDMCESCPDMTVWNGTLVHSCRMDEWRLYGGYVDAYPNPEFVSQSEQVIAADEIPVASPN
jgi:pyruvate-formate lyase-activating enzyme